MLPLQLEAGEVTAANALVKILRLQQLTSGFAVVDETTDKFLSTTRNMSP